MSRNAVNMMKSWPTKSVHHIKGDVSIFDKHLESPSIISEVKCDYPGCAYAGTKSSVGNYNLEFLMDNLFKCYLDTLAIHTSTTYTYSNYGSRKFKRFISSRSSRRLHSYLKAQCDLVILANRGGRPRLLPIQFS